MKMAPYPVLGTDDPRPVRAVHIRSIRERRLGEFIGGQYGQFNLASLLFEARTDKLDVIKLARWDPPSGSKPSFDQAVQQDYKPCKKGELFGPSWTNHWVKVDIKVPEEWREKEWLQLEFDPGCEAMIFDVDGLPLQGITGGYEDNRRVDFPLSPAMRHGVRFYIEVSANAMFGLPSVSEGGDPDPNRYFQLASADVVVKRPGAWKLMWDFNTLRGCVDEMPRDGILQNKALWVANEIQNTFRKADLSSIDRCRKIAEEVLGQHWERSGHQIFKKENAAEPTVIAIGHCHIDSCWLWPRSVTQQKVARSWSTQLALMERYPEHRFIASQAAQFKWMEELYPKLFAKIQDAVKAGTFQPIGGSWVECDANLPSGEAFVRQFLYGQRYLLTRFGQRSNVFWLPDSFGYNAQIPQLARSAGLDYFMTQKLSWSNVNTFPHSTVMWQGLDGSQVITHFSPVDNYDSQCGVNDITKCIRNNKNLDVQPTGLLLYGFGDGGGGATEVMVQNLRRARAVHENGHFEMPKVTIAKSMPDFFDNVTKITEGGRRLPVWSGDLYLEFHRGVFTSHGSIKRWNRKLEILLHNVEWTCTLASVQDASFKYQKDELDALWEMLLFNQFHDILPGSSIHMVYDDAEHDYAEIERRAYSLLKAAHATLFAPAPLGTFAASNTLALPRRELVVVPIGHPSQAPFGFVNMTPDQSKAVCILEDPTGCGLAVHRPCALSALHAAEAFETREQGRSHSIYVLCNAFLAVRVEHGRITSIHDNLSKRELLARGRTAGLTIYEDYPPSFDAWETEMYSLDTEEEIAFDSIRVVQKGLRDAGLVLEASFGKSKVKMVLSLGMLPATAIASDEDARAPLVIQTEIDWQEKHRFLRFSVPTALQAAEASYETQFGLTKRPTHRNTSWDAAKFEACGHRFVDLSEPAYGCTLVTDCKYGYSVEGGTMRVSLLKAGTYPDAHQDEGKHVVNLAVYPHVHALEQSDAISYARIFNNPMDAIMQAAPCPHVPSVSMVSASTNIVIDTLKRGEADFSYSSLKASGQKSIILRLYQSVGTHEKATLQIANIPIKSITTTNILEDDVEAACSFDTVEPFDNLTHRIPLVFRPFEVKTLRMVLH
ncbi:glycoside hydrolase family 38 protein [Tilletiaria anomala UBC 951]|uniref:alpha-mannosidase n=1 Tax=Tilletiaria anomala (strain ATCC 24038 / CBS 436.72 / UBC 951) TaxID=1037660 RepID=A0A066W0G4_TILAU|nr:glycoside hydrolase family 38 protein [Tilletiaria anomala UBC 951]KDN44275.1 glycoside hydrolase family 38 protein [Tilletiaria anomala UBC 951]